MIKWRPKGLGDPHKPPAQGVIVDVDSFPIVTVTIHGALTDAQLEEYLACMDGLGSGPPTPGVMVMDLSNAAAFNARQRKRQADWIAAQDPSRTKDSLGVAFAITSTMVRGALRAIFWLSPPPHAYEVCPSLLEAQLWAEIQLEKAGVKRGSFMAHAAAP